MVQRFENIASTDFAERQVRQYNTTGKELEDIES